MAKINLSTIVGNNYADVWNNKSYKEFVIGGRASKKSTTLAIRLIYRIMSYKNTNAIVIRRFYNTLRQSCYQQLVWAIEALNVSHLWHKQLSPLSLTYKPTKQQIIFRGLDNPESITSIKSTVGIFNFVWFEEASQIESETLVDKVEFSIRGHIDAPGFKQLTFSLNPWANTHWINQQYHIPYKKGNLKDDYKVFVKTYLDNEFLPKEDINRFEALKVINPRRYQIEGLGSWGISEGLIYTNYKVQNFSVRDIANQKTGNGYTYTPIVGIDFGYTNPTAIVLLYLSEAKKQIYVCFEHKQNQMTNEDIYNTLSLNSLNKANIIADSEDPRSIEYLKSRGCNIKPATKGNNSIQYGINILQHYTIIVHPTCEHIQQELATYRWQDKSGQKQTKPVKDNDHLLDALRYAVVQDKKQNIWGLL